MAKTSEGGAATSGAQITGQLDLGVVDGNMVTAIAYSDGTVHLSVGGRDFQTVQGTLLAGHGKTNFTGLIPSALNRVVLADGSYLTLAKTKTGVSLVSNDPKTGNQTHAADIPNQQQLTTSAGQEAAGQQTVQQQQANQPAAATTPKPGTSATPAATGGFGGGGGGGVTIINQAPAAAGPAPATGVDWSALQQQYGYAAGLFQSNPELQGLVKQATANKWTDQRFIAAVQNSQWWKTHTDAQRKYIVEKTGNPGQLNADRQSLSLSIANQAAKDGVQLAPTRLAAMVEDALKGGWNQDQINKALSSEYVYNAAHPDATAQALKQEAAKYLVPISDQTLQTWAQHVIAGQADQSQFDAYLAEQAKSLFPGMAAAIDAGVAPATYVDPYRTEAVRILGVNPADVNFLDPKWSKALFQVDPKTGARTSMSLSDWQRTLMTDPTYNYAGSQNGQKAQFDIAQQIEKIMGSPVATTA